MSLGNPLRVRHSLVFRMTLWYAGIFTSSSCVAFLFFYMLITSVIRERTDRDLLDQAGRFSRLLAADGVDAVKRVAVVEAQAAGERQIFIRFLSRRGDAFSSSNMSYWRDIGISREAVRELVEGRRTVFETVVIPERRHEVRILYAAVGPDVILQLGQAMENQTQFLEAFKKIFIITMAFLVLAAAAIGWFMAKKALSGLEAVTRTARQISGSSLAGRVPVTRRGDEVDQLAITFNQMLDRIQKLVKEIKEMSDNIAHDLKSPLTRIRGMAEVTLTTETSLNEYRGMAAGTIEECDRLLDMINTTLLISRTEAGVGGLDRRDMDMSLAVREACALFQPLAEEKGLRMTLGVPDALPVYADKRMIQRMIANLLDNAIKYTPEGGELEVSLARSEEGTLTFRVKDTGVGISEEHLPHVFERFFRGDPSRAQPGDGLGLSLAQAIARAHGGDIHVAGAPDKGSTFSVVLPGSPPA